MPLPCLRLRAAVEQLRSAAAEDWSGLTGVPVVAIEVRADDAVPTAALAAATQRLAAIACPSIVLVAAEVPPEVRAFVAAADVVVATRAELDMLGAAVTVNPRAAAVLVQVLRAGAGCSVVDGLAIESLAYATLQAGPEHAAWLAARGPATSEREDATSTVRLERADAGLVITLDRPSRHNAFSARMRDELAEALLVAASEAMPVVLCGAGPSFCSGGDLDEFGTRPDPATAHLVRTTRSPARLLAAVAARVRVELHGACIGAGIELAAFAREVVATPDAFVQLPELAMGLIPGAGGTVSLPRRIGRQRTGYLALSGARLDAMTAKAWGLIDELVAPRDLS